MVQMYVGVHFTSYSMVVTVGAMEGHLVESLNAVSFREVFKEICAIVI